MPPLLTGRNIEIGPALRQLVDRKLAKLHRMLNDSLVSAQVVLAREKYRHISEITIHARGDHMLHGLGDASDWPLSLKEAVDKIGQQAHRLKGKWAKGKRRRTSAGRLPAARSTSIAPEMGVIAPRVIRVPRHTVRVMKVEEAALKVATDEGAFLVFRDASNDSINVLYRRRDGHLGLVESDV